MMSCIQTSCEASDQGRACKSVLRIDKLTIRNETLSIIVMVFKTTTTMTGILKPLHS